MTKQTNTHREQFWDIIKGVAIILMLFGHSIQCGQGIEYYRNYQCFVNPVFKLIYGFHMPLFMFVSGYFFYNSIKKRTLLQLWHKLFVKLFIPLITFSALKFLFNKAELFGTLDLFSLAKCGVQYFSGSLWFLWVVLYSSILLGFCNKTASDNWLVQTIIIVILYCVPDVFNTCYFKFMYPFFFLGYQTNKRGLMDRINNNYLTVGIMASAIYVILMFTLFTTDTYIYTTQVYIFQADGIFFHIYNDVLRILVGLIGITGCVSLMKFANIHINSKRVNTFLACLGANSMGIYCFQDLVVSKLPYFISSQLPVLTVFFTFFFLLVFSYTMTKLTQKNKTLNLLLLGGR